jgi:predicted RNA-binding Zn ribbon-like protein
MKKALPERNEVFVSQKDGKLIRWDYGADEVIEAVNDSRNLHPVFIHLRKLLSRFIEEGATDEFLDDINHMLSRIKYRKYILPADIRPSPSNLPSNGYVDLIDHELNPEAYAADEFSKLLTSGMLQRLKTCEMDGCENLFLGPRQAKWCSKTCGSKSRVRAKRRRDSQ